MSDELASYIRLHASRDFDKARLGSHLEMLAVYLAKKAATEDFRAEIEAEEKNQKPLEERDPIP